MLGIIIFPLAEVTGNILTGTHCTLVDLAKSSLSSVAAGTSAFVKMCCYKRFNS